MVVLCWVHCAYTNIIIILIELKVYIQVYPSSSFFFSEKKLLGSVVLPCFIFIGLRVFIVYSTM